MGVEFIFEIPPATAAAAAAWLTDALAGRLIGGLGVGAAAFVSSAVLAAVAAAAWFTDALAGRLMGGLGVGGTALVSAAGLAVVAAAAAA